VVFGWGAAILDVLLALVDGIRAPLGLPARARSVWRAMPGDAMGRMVMFGCGITAPTRTVDAGDVTAVLVEDPRIGRWFRIHSMPIQAQTLGRYVLARETVPPDILAHECEHIRQWGRFGPFYLALYFGSSVVAAVRGRRAYWDNGFEAAARRRADGDTASRRDALHPGL
jgi:hypothetical protein